MAYFGPSSDQVQPWWVLAIAGVVSILFGLAALFWPHITLAVLIVLFGVFALINGLAEIFAMLKAIGEHRTWWTHLLLGLLSIAAGLVVFAYPGMTVVVLVYVIGFWAVAIGIMEIIAALTTGEFLLVIAGVISILFGLLLMANPGIGALAYVMVIGLFALVRGILLLIASIRAPSVSPVT